MASLAIPQIEPRLNPDREALLARLLPIPHSPESMDGISYYDEEFAMAQSDAHRKSIYFLGGLLDRVAAVAGLRGVGDYPIWYWIPEQGAQRALYPDFALTANPRIEALTAKDLLWVLEVVTTSRPAKMHKDTVRMRDHNAFHGVPEFVLLFPEPDDPRSVVWHQYDAPTGVYQVVALSADRRYRSRAIPGLELEVLEPGEWTEGRKVRVYYQGQEFREAQIEEQFREAAERQAQQERQVREAAERQAQQERQFREAAERQAQQERQVREAAERETQHAQQGREAAERQAQHAQQAREAAEQQVEQLLARLKQAGLEP